MIFLGNHWNQINFTEIVHDSYLDGFVLFCVDGKFKMSADVVHILSFCTFFLAIVLSVLCRLTDSDIWYLQTLLIIEPNRKVHINLLLVS